MPKKLYEGGPQWVEDSKEVDARKKGSSADFSRDMKVGPSNPQPVKKYGKPEPSLESRIKAAKAKGFKSYDPGF
jgi:hypothetical protein